VSKLVTLLLPAEKNGEGASGISLSARTIRKPRGGRDPASAATGWENSVTHLTEYKLKLSSGSAPYMLGAGFDFDSGHGLIQADRALAGLVVTDHL